jgi:hypothetical protein
MARTTFKMMIAGEFRTVSLQRTRGEVGLVETKDGGRHRRRWVTRTEIEAAMAGQYEVEAVAVEVGTVASKAVEEVRSEIEAEGRVGGDVSIVKLDSTKPSWTKGLKQHGYKTVADVVVLGAEGMMKVNGIGAATAKRIYDEASEFVEKGGEPDIE